MKKSTKSTRKPLPTPEYDSTREQNVLLEAIHSDIKLIAEQHGSIVKKLEEHGGRFDKVESELNVVKTDLAVVKTDLAVVKTDLAVVKTDLAVVKTDLVAVKTDLVAVKTDLVAVKSDLTAVKIGLTAVETATMENSSGIKKLEVDVTQLKEGQQRIEQKLDIVTSDHEQRLQKLEAIR